MIIDEVIERFEKLLQLSALHGWCNEVDDELSNIQKNLRKNNTAKAKNYFTNILSSPNKKKNEYILAIVMLYKLNYPAFNITNSLFESLSDKIFNEDFDFLVKHLFHGKHPFSSNITNNLIKRVFFSYRRAINEAFLINSVIIDIPPDEAVLYLTILLCNKGLNDQNKAMVFFLLSRIDKKLPDNVFHETMKYIFKLGSLIQDIEQNPDHALSQSVDFRHELDHRPFLDTKIPPEQTKTETVSGDLEKEPEKPRDEKVSESKRAEPEGPKLERTPDSLEQIGNKTIERHETETQERQASEKVINDRETTLKMPKIDTKTGESTKIETGELQEPTKIQKLDVKKKSPQKEVSDTTPSEESTEITEEDEHYNVTFSKSLDEIIKMANEYAKKLGLEEETVEESLKESVDEEPEDEESDEEEYPEGVGKEDKTISGKTSDKTAAEEKHDIVNEKGKKRKTGKRLFKLPGLPQMNSKKMMIGGIGLLVIAAILILMNFLGGDTSTVPETVTPETVTPEAVTPEAVTPETVTPEAVTPETVTPETVTPETVTPETVTPETVTPETVTPETVTPETVTPETVTPETATPERSYIEQNERIIYTSDSGLKFIFNINGDKVTWSVNQDNSFWKLYRFVSGNKNLQHEPLKQMSNYPTWTDFLYEMTLLNPNDYLFGYIYPGQQYIVNK